MKQRTETHCPCVGRDYRTGKNRYRVTSENTIKARVIMVDTRAVRVEKVRTG